MQVFLNFKLWLLWEISSMFGEHLLRLTTEDEKRTVNLYSPLPRLGYGGGVSDLTT